MMLARAEQSEWLHELKHDNYAPVLEREARNDRNMWCTGGFFHSAGLGVDRNGAIKSTAELANESVFRFQPIQVQCDDRGNVEWHPDSQSANRFIFQVCDLDHYASAMIEAMRTLLTAIP